jgi:DNA-binding response OmpR family regulator
MLKSILVIDDDFAILEVMQMALSDAGFNVFTSSGTTNIISIIQQYQPDLLILDYFLEGKNGGDLCRQVKNNKLTANLPVILFSAYPDIVNFMGGYKCDAILEKPCDLANMITIVKELIGCSPNHALIAGSKLANTNNKQVH